MKRLICRIFNPHLKFIIGQNDNPRIKFGDYLELTASKEWYRSKSFDDLRRLAIYLKCDSIFSFDQVFDICRKAEALEDMTLYMNISSLTSNIGLPLIVSVNHSKYFIFNMQNFNNVRIQILIEFCEDTIGKVVYNNTLLMTLLNLWEVSKWQ